MANNLTLTGAGFITSASTPTPKFGSGALNAGYGDCPAGMIASLPFAISLRFYITAIPTAAVAIMAGQNSMFWLGFYNQKLHGEFGNVNTASVTATADPALNTWHTLTLSVSASTLTLRLDGTVVGTASTASSTGAFNIGTVGGAPSGVTAVRSHGGFETNYPFPGILDEVAFFKADAFPSGATDSSSAFTGSEANLLALYHLDGNGNDSTTLAVSILPNNANIYYSPGVWDATASRGKTIMAGAYFRTLIAGGATAISLLFDITADTGNVPEIMARVDRGPWVTQEVASSIALPMPTTNAWTTHLVEFIVKSTNIDQSEWNPQSTGTTFLGFLTAPYVTTTAPTLQAPLVGLVFGDSIVEGVRSLSQSAASGKETDNNDASVGWAYNLGPEVGAEIGTIGFGGQGWTVNGVGNVPPFPSTYNLLWGGGPSRSFTGVDFIVINQGTNDGGQGASTSAVQTAATNFLNILLRVTPTSTQIFLMRPFGGAMAAQMQAAQAACNNPARVTYVDTTGWLSNSDTSDNTHPFGYTSMANLAPRLAAVIRAKLSSLSGASSLVPQFRSGFH